MLKIISCASVFALLVAPVAANAAVRYDFVALSSFPTGPVADVISGSFSFTAADFIVADTNAPLTGCTASGSVSGVIACRELRFLPGFFGYDAVNFGVTLPDGTGLGPLYYFGPGAFAAAGTYDTVLFGADQAGRLTVTNLNTNTAVPEPASWAMMIAGFGLVGGMMRRKNALTLTKVSYA